MRDRLRLSGFLVGLHILSHQLNVVHMNLKSCSLMKLSYADLYVYVKNVSSGNGRFFHYGAGSQGLAIQGAPLKNLEVLLS